MGEHSKQFTARTQNILKESDAIRTSNVPMSTVIGKGTRNGAIRLCIPRWHGHWKNDQEHLEKLKDVLSKQIYENVTSLKRNWDNAEM